MGKSVNSFMWTLFIKGSSAGHGVDILLIEDEGHDVNILLIQNACHGKNISLIKNALFFRGKEAGHDVDILLTHPEEGNEKGLLMQILKRLDNNGLILQGRYEKNSYVEDAAFFNEKSSLQSTIDQFEKWLGILKTDVVWRHVNAVQNKPGDDNEYNVPKKLPKLSEGTLKFERDPSETNDAVNIDTLSMLANAKRPWLARRVDLIVVPYNQFFYALVGWTGSRQFNRSIRLYAEKRLNMKLSSHALYDNNKVCCLVLF